MNKSLDLKKIKYDLLRDNPYELASSEAKAYNKGVVLVLDLIEDSNQLDLDISLGLSNEELLRKIAKSIDLVLGGMDLGEFGLCKSSDALALLFKTFLRNPEYTEKTPEEIVIGVLRKKRGNVNE